METLKRPPITFDVSGNFGSGPSLRFENDKRIAVFSFYEARLFFDQGLREGVIKVLAVDETASPMRCDWVKDIYAARDFYHPKENQ